MSPLTDPLGPDLTATLRALKLGKLTATLPERLTLARQHNMPHADFLQLILSDEVARREAGSIALRAKNAGLDPAMRTETWDPTAAIRYDQRLWNELVSLRFLDGPHGALILGAAGVGKTHLATALGHSAVRRRRTVHMARADKLFKRLTAARLDNPLDYEYRRLTTVELLIIDDFALQPDPGGLFATRPARCSIRVVLMVMIACCGRSFPLVPAAEWVCHVDAACPLAGAGSADHGGDQGDVRFPED